MTIKKGYHPSHPDHELKLKNYKKPYKCDGCKEQGFGPRYRCECEDCDYELHKDCMFNTPTTSHDFFPGSTFKFFDKPPKNCNCDKCKISCDACGKEINGFVYHCEEHKNGRDLHPCCRNLKEKMTIGEVKFSLHEKVMSKCIWCKSKTLKGTRSKIRGWSYMSECNNYHFHVYCVTEMTVEGWKTADCNENKALALENMELPLQRRTNGGPRGGKYWKIVKIFLTTIAAILLGDPTIALTSFVFDFITGL